MAAANDVDAPLALSSSWAAPGEAASPAATPPDPLVDDAESNSDDGGADPASDDANAQPKSSSTTSSAASSSPTTTTNKAPKAARAKPNDDCQVRPRRSSSMLLVGRRVVLLAHAHVSVACAPAQVFVGGIDAALDDAAALVKLVRRRPCSGVVSCHLTLVDLSLSSLNAALCLL